MNIFRKKPFLKIILCVLLVAVFACSCEIDSGINNKPVKPADGTPISSEASSEPQSSSGAASDTSDSSSAANSSSTAGVSSDQVSSIGSASSAETEDATSEGTSSATPNNSGVKYVAFTFDDGPSNTYTRKIVDKLNSYGGTGTFFVIGNLIGDKNGANIQYAVQNGCEIGIHAWTHNYSYKTCSDAKYNEEISKTADVIHKYLPDYNITLMRPVGGAITDARVKSSPYSVINWSVDSNDWRYKRNTSRTKAENVQIIYNNIMKQVGDGDIILMHEIYENSYEAFCKVAEDLNKQGYKFVTVTELIGKDNLQAGRKYLRR